MKKIYSSKNIIEGFKENNETIILYTYNNCFRYVSWYVLTNGGNNEDAKDVMQEAMILFFRNCKKSSFILESHPFTHINNLCKYIWLNKKKKNNKYLNINAIDELENINTYTIDTADNINQFEFEYEYEQKKQIYKTCFNMLMKECKTILTLSIKGDNIANITKKMNFKDDKTTIDKKRRCKEKLFKLIIEHPKYKNLNHEQ